MIATPISFPLLNGFYYCKNPNNKDDDHHHDDDDDDDDVRIDQSIYLLDSYTYIEKKIKRL